jgi:pimeloyl-ACP methyl ester carboxylesterase
MLSTLAETREVVIFDNMRCGQSTDSRPGQPLSVPTMANSTLALLDALRISKPDIWGWSLGGSIAYAMLAYSGDRVGNVIVASGSPGGPDAWLAPPAVLSNLTRAGARLNALLPFLFPAGVDDDGTCVCACVPRTLLRSLTAVSAHPGVLTGATTAACPVCAPPAGVCSWFAAFNSFSATEYTSVKQHVDLKALPEQLAALQDFARSADVGPRLGAAPNRVLVMHGVQDRVVPVRNAPAAAARLLGSWMLQFPGAGHALPFDEQQAMVL